jgi:hypothetical protein
MDRDMDVDQSVWKISPLDDRSCQDQNRSELTTRSSRRIRTSAEKAIAQGKPKRLFSRAISKLADLKIADDEQF